MTSSLGKRKRSTKIWVRSSKQDWTQQRPDHCVILSFNNNNDETFIPKILLMQNFDVPNSALNKCLFFFLWHFSFHPFKYQEEKCREEYFNISKKGNNFTSIHFMFGVRVWVKRTLNQFKFVPVTGLKIWRIYELLY